MLYSIQNINYCLVHTSFHLFQLPSSYSSTGWMHWYSRVPCLGLAVASNTISLSPQATIPLATLPRLWAREVRVKVRLTPLTPKISLLTGRTRPIHLQSLEQLLQLVKKKYNSLCEIIPFRSARRSADL